MRTSKIFYYLSIFFFKSYGDHRDLHSFPTRRSSDLGAPRVEALDMAALGAGGRVDHRVDQRRLARDRKSTRLNSSHPSISYAVFCLKKKKRHSAIDVTLMSRVYATPIFIVCKTNGSC